MSTLDVAGSPRPGPDRAAGPRSVANSLFNLATQGCYAALQVIVVCLIARAMSPPAMGAYYGLVSLVMAVQWVTECGVGTVLSHRLASDPCSQDRTVGEASALFARITALSVGVFAIVNAVASTRSDLSPGSAAFLSAALACVCLQVQRYCTGILRGRETFLLENVARLAQGGSLALGVAGLVWWGLAGLAPSMVVMAVSQAVAAAILLGGLPRKWWRVGWRLDRRSIAGWLADAVPLGMGDAVRGLTWNLDTLLLGLMQPASAVAIYSVAYRPLGPLNWIPFAISSALFPDLVRFAKADRASLSGSFAASTRLTWTISLPITFTIFAFAEPIVLAIAGPGYREAAAPLRVLIFVSCLSSVSYQFRFLFAAIGRPREYVRLTAAVLALEALIEVALIPPFGFQGACAGSLIGELAFTIAGAWICRGHGVRFDYPAFVKAGLAACLMGGVLESSRSAPWPLQLAAALAMPVLYLISCRSLGVFRPGELARFLEISTSPGRSLLRRIGRRPRRGPGIGANRDPRRTAPPDRPTT